MVGLGLAQSPNEVWDDKALANGAAQSTDSGGDLRVWLLQLAAIV